MGVEEEGVLLDQYRVVDFVWVEASAPVIPAVLLRLLRLVSSVPYNMFSKALASAHIASLLVHTCTGHSISCGVLETKWKVSKQVHQFLQVVMLWEVLASHLSLVFAFGAVFPCSCQAPNMACWSILLCLYHHPLPPK